MSWIVVGTMAATTALSSAQASRKRKQEKLQNEAAAVQTAYSPWTGLGQGEITNNAPGGLEAALQGGIQGASLAGNFKQAGMFGSKASQPKMALDSDGSSFDSYYMNKVK
jgi:hypothetical protein